MADKDSLGSDENSRGKGIYFTFIAIVLFIFSGAMANLTQANKDLATFYLIFAIFPMLVVLADMGFRQKGKDAELPDSITIEKESPIFGEFGRATKALIIAGSLAIGPLILFMVGGQSTQALIASPTFNAIDPGPVGSAYLSAAAGLIENLAFFGVLMPIVYVFIKKSLGGFPAAKAIAIVLALLVASGSFTVYHFARYGNSPQTMDTVFMFGMMCGGVTAATGMLVTCDSIHAFNNFGVTLFSQVSMDITLWVILYEFIVIGGLFLYLRRGNH